MPKLLEWRGNGLNYFFKSETLVGKSVGHPPIRSVRFVQVEYHTDHSSQQTDGIGDEKKDGLPL